MKRRRSVLLALTLGIVLLVAAGCSSNNLDTPSGVDTDTDNIQQDDIPTTETPDVDGDDSIDSDTTQDSDMGDEIPDGSEAPDESDTTDDPTLETDDN